MRKHPIRRGVPWARKTRGETSSAAVAAMNSRRFIRSSSQLEETGADYQVSMIVVFVVSKVSTARIRRHRQGPRSPKPGSLHPRTCSTDLVKVGTWRPWLLFPSCGQQRRRRTWETAEAAETRGCNARDAPALNPMRPHRRTSDLPSCHGRDIRARCCRKLFTTSSG